MRKQVNIAAGFFLAASILITFLHPAKPAEKLPPDLHVPIVALELATSDAEVFSIIGQSTDHDYRRRYYIGTVIDFVYILSYLGAFFFLGRSLSSRSALQPVQFKGLVVVVSITGLADIWENIHIFNLLASSPGDDLNATIYWLGRSTYLKWGALGLASGIIAAGLARYGKRKVAILFAAAFGASLVGLFFRTAIELNVLALAAAWPWVFVKTLPLKYPWFSEERAVK